MKCHQCERPGIYKYNDAIILCLECHVKASDVQYRDDQIRLQQALLNAAMLNKANDDLHAVAPWGPRSSPIPVAAIAKVANKGTTLTNNIAINNSNVGVLNTGDLAKIDAAVTVTQGSDAEELGLVIKRLTESVVATEELTDETKKEVGELLADLTGQITGKRSRPVMSAILKAIEDRIKGVNAAWSLFERINPLISTLIGV